MKNLEQLIYKNAELVEDLNSQVMAAPPNVKKLVKELDLNNRYLSLELVKLQSRLKEAGGYVKAAHDLNAPCYLEEAMERLKSLNE